MAMRPDSAARAIHIQEFATPCRCGASGCIPSEITSGPDGNLWFTEYEWNHIGRITPAGRIQQFTLPTTCTGGCFPYAITSGPDGNLWFTAPDGNRIGPLRASAHHPDYPPPPPRYNPTPRRPP